MLRALLALVLGLAAHAVAEGESFSCPTLPPASVGPSSSHYAKKPHVDGKFKFVNGVKQEFDGEVDDVTSPVYDELTGSRAVIGTLPRMNDSDAMDAVAAAAAAWDQGQGIWPQVIRPHMILMIPHTCANHCHAYVFPYT